MRRFVEVRRDYLPALCCFGLNRVEHRFLDVRLIEAASLVDEGIRTTLLDLRVLRLQLVLGRVIAEGHVARQGTHHFERAVEFANNFRCKSRGRAQAAAEDDIISFPAVLHLHRPGCAAPGMARRQMRNKSRTTERHRLSIVQDFVDGVLLAARFHRLERRHILSHHHHLRSGQPLDHCIALLVITMRMVPQQNFDIGKLEA